MGMIMHDDVPYGEGTSYTQGTGIAINNNIIAVDADNTPTENSEKPVKSKGVYSALESNSAKSASLLKSTVGWTGKNLLPNDFPNQTINGFTCTKDVNGIINLNGICTVDTFRRIYLGNIPNGTYIISDNVPNHSDCSIYINAKKLDGTTVYSIADTMNKPTLNADNTLYKEYDIGLYLKNGIQFSNLKVYPMLRDASITDDTYEPYHPSVEEEIEQIYADNGVLGAKNLLEVTANTQTLSGVTFTVNRDSDGNVINVTVNGTASANTSFVLRTKTPLAAGKSYIISRGEAGDGDFQMVATAWNNGSYVKNIIEIGAGGYTEKSFMADYNGYNDIQISIFVRSGKTISNAKVYPMLRLASDPDDTYVPYAMTNRELTEKKINLSDLKTVVASSSDFAAFKTAIADL